MKNEEVVQLIRELATDRRNSILKTKLLEQRIFELYAIIEDTGLMTEGLFEEWSAD